MKEAMDLWSDVANVSFNWWTGSDVIWLGVKELDGGGLHRSGSLVRDWVIWIDPDQTVPASPLAPGAWHVGRNGFATYIHEVGHALGLDHPGDYNGEARPVRDQLYDLDTRANTAMSYFDESLSNIALYEFRGQWPQTPTWLDIDAVQRIYGANLTTRNGDNVYGYNADGDTDFGTDTVSEVENI
jgi:serralysin